MTLDNFIPTIWHARVLARLQTALRYGQAGVINRDYEGEIRQAGDTVQINSIGPVTVTNYTKNSDHAQPETLEDETTSLVIDQSKMFAFQVDDVDKAQTQPDVMDEAMRESGYALAKVADAYLASLWAEASVILGSAADPITLGDAAEAADAYTLLVQMKQELDENDVPEDDRTAIVPSWFESELLLDPRFVNASDMGENVLANGSVGRAAGFNIVKSNATPHIPVGGSVTQEHDIVQASHPMYGTFAEQINKVEAYRPERRFADAVKGLHLYGAAVTRPEALVVARVTQADE